MAKIKLQPEASSTNVFTIVTPAGSADRTITLPDASGTLAFTTGDDDKLPLSGGTLTGDLNFGDNVDANFGAGADLKIYHDASNSFIKETGTGGLRLWTSELQVLSGNGNQNIMRGTQEGAVTLYHTNNPKLVTTSIGANITNDQGNVSFITRAEVGASGNWSGGGFDHVANATAGSRRAMMWLDADGGNFGGSDYYYIEKTGGGGVQHIVQNNADMKFATNATTRMTISNAGDVTLNSGNIVMSGSNGILLGGTAAANKLDDYEEGTWNVGYSGCSASGHASAGWYTKIGNVVYVTYHSGSVSISSSSGAAKITGLPFAVRSGDEQYSQFLYTHGTAVQNSVGGHFSGTYMQFVTYNATSNESFVNGTKYLMVSGFYYTDS